MIFITGANGLVGSYIVKQLLSQNIRPRCLKRKNSDLSLLKEFNDEIDWVEGDLLDIIGLTKLLNGVHQIIHAAGLVSFNPKHYDLMLKVNVEGTANLVNAALNLSIKKFFFVSSISTLGKGKIKNTISESSMWEESDENSYYSKTKYLAELEVWRGIEEGLEGIIINPTIILGPGNWLNGSTKLFKYGYDENIFYPSGTINFIDVRDVANLTLLLLNSGIFNERYILNSGTTTYKEFFNKVALAFDKKPPKTKATKLISELAWRLEKIKAFIFKKDPLLTKETARASKNNLIYENQKIKNLFNYNFIELDTTINWVTESLQEKYIS